MGQADGVGRGCVGRGVARRRWRGAVVVASMAGLSGAPEAGAVDARAVEAPEARAAEAVAAGVVAQGADGARGQDFVQCLSRPGQAGCKVPPYAVEATVPGVVPVSASIFGASGGEGYVAHANQIIDTVRGGNGGRAGDNLGLPDASVRYIAPQSFEGAPGGDGGLGLRACAGAVIANKGSIRGGSGGDGGAAGSFAGHSGVGGNGGAGAPALRGSGFVLDNEGVIRGGAGGAAGATPAGGIVGYINPADFDYTGRLPPLAQGRGGAAAPAIVAGGGATIVNHGTISSGGPGAGAIEFVDAGNILAVTPGSEIHGEIRGSAGNLLRLTGRGAAALDLSSGAQYAGFAGVDVVGATWTLQGASHDDIPWSLRGGVLQLASSAPLGGAALRIDGGTLRALGDLQIRQALQLDGRAHIDNGGHALRLDGPSRGNGELVLRGGGVTTLANVANRHAGGTTVLGGSTLRVVSEAALGPGPLRLQASADQPAGLLVAAPARPRAARSFVRDIELVGGRGLVDNDGQALRLDGAMHGAGTLELAGGGVTELTNAANDHRGGTRIAAGSTARLLAREPLGGGRLTLAGTPAAPAVLRVDADVHLTQPLRLAGDGGVLHNDGHVVRVAGALDGRGALVLSGNGLTCLDAAASTHRGGTQVGPGATLQIASGRVLGRGALRLHGVPQRATLRSSADTTLAVPVHLAGDARVTVAPATTLAMTGGLFDAGSDATALVVDGGGTLRLDAPSGYRGATTVQPGTWLALGPHGSVASFSTLRNQGVLDLRAAGAAPTLQGSLLQDASAALLLPLRPGQGPGLDIAGAARVDGLLVLLPQAGSYRPGRVVVLRAQQGLEANLRSCAVPGLSAFTPLRPAFSRDAYALYLDLSADGLIDEALAGSLPALRAVLRGSASGLAGLARRDCPVFDAHGLCVAVGGGQTVLGANGPRTDFTLLEAGWRVAPSLHLSAWLQQPLNQRIGSEGVARYTSARPAGGVQAYWQQRPDVGGWIGRLAAAYSDQELEWRRGSSPALGAGWGRTDAVARAWHAELGLRHAVGEALQLTPWLGGTAASALVRGFTEAPGGAAPAVEGLPARWSYRDAYQHSVTVDAGLRMRARRGERTELELELWLQRVLRQVGASWGLSHSPDSASLSVDGPSRRYLAGLALQLRHHITPSQDIVFSLSGQQQPYASALIVDSRLGWQVGF